MRDYLNSISYQINGNSSSQGGIIKIKESSKDIELVKMKKNKYNKTIHDGLISFYQRNEKTKDTDFDIYYKHDIDIFSQTSFTFKNEKAISEVKSLYNNLKDKDKEYLFGSTMNKYRNTYDFKCDGQYITYKYIDTFGNEKSKKEGVLSFIKYCGADINPKEFLPNVEVSVTISNRIEDKEEILDHSGFNGSCQRPENCIGHAVGYHDMYYNGGMCVIKMHIGESFIGRSLARILYDEDGEMYLHIDRIYRVGILGTLGEDVYDMLHKTLLDKGYKILTSYIRTEGKQILFTKSIDKKIIKKVFIGHGRKLNEKFPHTYYNNSMTQGVCTSDNWVFDLYDGTRNEIYLLSLKKGA